MRRLGRRARGGAQVGYGDVVAQSDLGKLAVLAMICVGVVLIPVQTSALYAQLTARRVTLGAAPGRTRCARAPRRQPARRMCGLLCGPGSAAPSPLALAGQCEDSANRAG